MKQEQLEIAYNSVLNLKNFLSHLFKDSEYLSISKEALSRDIKFIDESLAILKSEDPDQINELWKKVQYLSRFFGGYYVPEKIQNEFERLTEKFFSEMLNLIQQIRC